MRAILFFIVSFSIVSQAAKTTATYQVPVPAKLVPYATFVLENTSLEIKNETADLTYYLPLEIVHSQIHDTPIHLKGKVKSFPQQFQMTDGEHAQASCSLRKKDLTCIVSYGFAPNLESVAAYLKKTYPAREFEMRFQVARAFVGEDLSDSSANATDGTESGGVVSVTLP